MKDHISQLKDTLYYTQQFLNSTRITDGSLNRLNNSISYLKETESSNVIYEKIEYRNIEHEQLYNINKLIDVLFYSFYFAFVFIMICIGNTKKEYFLIYLFVGLIPFIYPFLFKLLLYINKYLTYNIHGPKNAFVSITNTFYA